MAHARTARAAAAAFALVCAMRLPGVAASCSEYIGCFLDNLEDTEWSYTVPASSLSWLAMTVSSCVDECKAMNYSFAGIQDGESRGGISTCSCGMSYGKWGAQSAWRDRCHRPCPGDSRELCGGFNGWAPSNAVYRTEDSCNAGRCVRGKAYHHCECEGTGKSGVRCELEGTCRFADSFDWGRLSSDTEIQDAYIRQVLKWDGRFASPGYGIDANGITRDKVAVDSSGRLVARSSFTWGSKESLHIGMLALVVTRRPLAWHWMHGAEDEAHARSMALDRLKKIMDKYEKFSTEYPGCGGFLPINEISVDHDGFKLHSSQVRLPGIDSGQLAWSMYAASIALAGAGDPALAQRYQAYVDLLRLSAKTLWFVPEKHHLAATAEVLDTQQPCSVENREHVGRLQDPYEGELMIMWVDLMSTWGPRENRNLIWRSVKQHQKAVTYSDSRLPSGPITVQRGWRFSAHEQWKYLVLPYTDNHLVARLLRNGEKARTWNSHLHNVPGLYGSCYAPAKSSLDDGGVALFVNTLGVPSLSMGFVENEQRLVAPYAAFPLTLVNRGLGLAWHRSMAARPKMQGSLGVVDASSTEADPRPSLTYTWDAKVTFDLAALGGLGPLIGQAFDQVPERRKRFEEILESQHAPFATLTGEDTPDAPLPGRSETDAVPSSDPDMVGCLRLSPLHGPEELVRQIQADAFFVNSGSMVIPRLSAKELSESPAVAARTHSTLLHRKPARSKHISPH